jgi:hypothetical protein
MSANILAIVPTAKDGVFVPNATGRARLTMPKTEAQIRAEIKAHFKDWLILDFSDKRRMPPGLKDAPDLIIFLEGATLCIECKTTTNRLSDGQIKWREKLRPFLGKHLRYVCARRLYDVLDETRDLYAWQELEWAEDAARDQYPGDWYNHI